MDPLFHILIFTCLAFKISEGFLIIHVQEQQCLLGGKTAVLGRCNLTDPNQQWRWTEDKKLFHVRWGLCLGFSKLSAASSRSTFIRCPQAPSWTCHNTEGLLQVANSSFFLTKQGQRGVIKMGRKYPHSWMQLDVDDKGKPANENLCPQKGDGVFCKTPALQSIRTKCLSHLQDTETSVQSSRGTSSPFNTITSSPENFLRSSTDIFIRNVTENYSKNVIEKHHQTLKLTEVTKKSWIPTTAYHYSSTTEEDRHVAILTLEHHFTLQYTERFLEVQLHLFSSEDIGRVKLLKLF